MKELIKFYNFFNKKQKIYFITFCIIFFIASVFQLMGISSIVLAVAVFSDNEAGNFINQFVDIDFSETNAKITLFILIIFFLVMSALVNFLCLYSFVKIASIATIILETKFFNYYNNLGYFQKSAQTISKYVTFFKEYIPRIRSEFLPSLFTFVYNLSLAIIIMISVLIVATELFLQIGVIIIFVYGTFYFFTKSKIKKYANDTISILYKYSNFTLNFFNNFKSYKFLNRLLIEKNNNFYVTKINNLIVKQFLLQSAPRVLIELILYIGIFLLVVNIFIFNIEIELVTLTFFAVAASKAFPTINQLFASFIRIEQSIPLLKSFNIEFSNIIEFNKRNIRSIKPLKFEKFLNIENLSFKFLEEEKTDQLFKISNLNLEIKKNSITGIAGKTGSGKTTIVDLISGIYEPDEGCIFLDDTKIDITNLHRYRKNISYISQNIFLASGTIKEIIQFGSEKFNNDDLKLEIASKKAQIYDFINNLPDKFQTIIGDGGVDLSSGQKQRLLLARFFYSDSKILILDEATNLLDFRTEDSLVNNLIKEKEDKVIIVVTHGIHNLKKFDNIIYIEDGNVLAEGNFETLKKESIKFREFIHNSGQ